MITSSRRKLAAAGYTLDHMTRLREAGTYDLLMASVVLPHPYRRGDEDDALAFIRAPTDGRTHRGGTQI